MPTEDDVFEGLLGAAADLRSALVGLEGAVDTVRRERRRGVPFNQIYRDQRIRDVRDTVYERLTAFERAFNATRSLGVRLMVDEDGMTLTEVSQLMRRSRQFVTRLYRSNGPNDSDKATPPGT
jgi:hypothetical protein